MKNSKKLYLAIPCLFLITASLFLIDRSRFDSDNKNLTSSKESPTQNESLKEAGYPLSYTEELQVLLAQHFETDYSEPTTHLAMLKDSENYDRLIRVNYLRGLTMDLGINLEQLEPYGLVRLQNGTYEIDHLLNPGWLTLDLLLSALFSNDYIENILTPALLQDDFDLENLAAVKIYLDNTNPQLEVAQSALSILENEIGKLDSVSLGQENRPFYTLLSVRINEIANYASSQILKNWALELMEQIDLPSQALLISHLSENLSTTKLFPSPIDVSVDGLIEEISSGRLRNEYRNLIEGLSQTKESLK